MDHADYAAAVAALRSQLLAYAASVWAVTDLGDAGLDALVELMVSTVQAAQIQMANLTSVYMAAATATEPLPVADDVTRLRGVDPEIVYARPIVTARSALAQGKSFEDARKAGGRRLENISGTDLQMAKTYQAQRSLEGSGRQYYRRVLTGSENCAMCIIASTQRYKVKALLPIHPGCDCDIAPLAAGEAVNHVIDVEALNATHQRVKAFTGVEDRGGRSVDYRKLLITHEHGEIGPVLGWVGQKFTSAADLAA